MNTSVRRGLFAGGNFIVDQAKVIDVWPEQDTLANILSESVSNGGGPYNILRDMSRLSPGMPLEACSLIGNDANGDWIENDCRQSGIDVSQLHRTREAPTSYTDVMNVEGTGHRTYFHQPGANALLDVNHFDFSATSAKVFYLGYPMLLEKLDQMEDGLTGAAQLLRSAREAGLIASVDCVSAPSERFRDVVLSAFKETDILFINEFEMGQVLGRTVPDDRIAMTEAAVELASRHSRPEILVVLHAATGAVVASPDGLVDACPALAVPESEIIGTTGAGDAFAAGFLLGIHEDRPVSECLQYAVSSAAMSLLDVTPSHGLDTLGKCLEQTGKYGSSDF